MRKISLSGLFTIIVALLTTFIIIILLGRVSTLEKEVKMYLRTIVISPASPEGCEQQMQEAFKSILKELDELEAEMNAGSLTDKKPPDEHDI